MIGIGRSKKTSWVDVRHVRLEALREAIAAECARLRAEYEQIERDQAFTTASVVSLIQPSGPCVARVPEFFLNASMGQSFVLVEEKYHANPWVSFQSAGIRYALSGPLFYVPFEFLPVSFDYAYLPAAVGVVVGGLELVRTILDGRTRQTPRRRRHTGEVASFVRCLNLRVKSIRRTAPVSQEKRVTSSTDDELSFLSEFSTNIRENESGGAVVGGRMLNVHHRTISGVDHLLDGPRLRAPVRSLRRSGNRFGVCAQVARQVA